MEINFNSLTLLSTSFKNILSNLDNPIAEYLVDANNTIEKYNNEKDPTIKEAYNSVINEKLTDFCRQVTLKNEDFLVSYLPKGCTPEYNYTGDWKKKNRQEGKPGKILQKLIGQDKFTNAEFEKFVYELKAYWSTKGYVFKIVSGEDIRYWYNSENYYEEKSTLGNSCMRYSECSRFFDVYCKCPECQMLIALKDDKLVGRALVWTIDNQTFLDRVYYIEDCLYNMFINYAKQHNWLIREDNSLLDDDDDQRFLSPEDNYEEGRIIEFTLNIPYNFSSYPYMDSFRYKDCYANKMYTFVPTREFTYCSCTDGSTFAAERECPNCGCYADSDNIVYSDWLGYSGCLECMSWSEFMNDYYSNDCCVEVFDKDGFEDCVDPDWATHYGYVYVENIGKYVHKENSNLTTNENGEYIYEH